MAEVEALADAITGGTVARAVEPDAGEGRGARLAPCLNCGMALIGEHCHACGQNAHVHRTLTAFGHDLLHGVLHFEGKIWRTLPMLAWRPGDLTRRYVAGERARFVSPLALFLFCVFLMFAVLANLPSGDKRGSTLDGFSDGLFDTRSSLAKAVEREEGQIAKLIATRATRVAEKRDVRQLDVEIASARREVAQLREAVTKLGTVKFKVGGEPSDWLDQRWEHAKENPQLLIYKVKTNAYKYGWALIPLSLPFMWLLFPFSRKFRMYDHAVFVTYSLCFMSLLSITLALLMMIDTHGAIISTLASAAPPLHMYRQLRGAYSLRRWSAALRTLALMVTAGTVLLLFTFLLIGLGLVD